MICDEIDNKLFELQKAYNRYCEIDKLANFVLFALSKYIFTGRATRQFEKTFLEYPNEKFEYLIKKCLNSDRSDDGIIKTCKIEFARNNMWLIYSWERL